MIKFNELRITPDNKYLIIDVNVEDSSYYEDVIIDSIVIDTQNTYVNNGPSSTPIFTYRVEDSYTLVYSHSEPIEVPVQESSTGGYVFAVGDSLKKRVRLTLSTEQLPCSFSDNMFFVYVTTSGDATPDTPTELKKTKAMRTVVNLHPIYKESIAYIKELNYSCTLPKRFVDFILKVKALELSIKTNHYQEAIKYWKKLFKK